jgi:hypothetical protein
MSGLTDIKAKFQRGEELTRMEQHFLLSHANRMHDCLESVKKVTNGCCDNRLDIHNHVSVCLRHVH